MWWNPIRAIVGIVSVGVLAMGAVAARAQANYLTDLGAVAPALGINNSGQVVLQSYIYSNGTLTALPPNFMGAAINSSGEVAGGFPGNCGEPNNAGAPATYANGVLTIIPALSGCDPEQGVSAQGLGINDSGAVVGVIGDNGDQPAGWLYSNNIYVGNIGYFANPPEYCPGVEARGINNSGQITGGAVGPEVCGQFHDRDVFIFDGTSYQKGGPEWTDLGPGVGYAINASGEVTGISYTVVYVPAPADVNGVPALFSNGTVTVLSNSPGAGYAINASGFVVGDGVNNTNDAFLYNGITIDLNNLVLPADPLKPYVTLTDARGINDSGLIVVNGIDSRTQAQHAYLFQVPMIQVTPTAFPLQTVGTTSAGQSVTLTNVGTTPVALGNVSIAPGPFNIQSNTCLASLAPNAACAITLTFAPAAPGTPSAILTVLAGGLPLPITVSGVTPLVITSFAPSAPTAVAADSGLDITLSWASSNAAASCQGGGGGYGDEWSGNDFPASGTDLLAEFSAGTYTYVLTCTVGSQTATAQTSVVVVWPVVTAALSASAPSVAPHQAVTLNWSSSKAAKSCVASGGGTGDGWANALLPASGSKAVTEPTIPAAGASTTLTFTVTCKPGVREYPGSASVKVVQKGESATASSGGQSSGSSSGGGAFDTLSLAFLFGAFALHRIGRRPRSASTG
jgi:hypothetical protein